MPSRQEVKGLKLKAVALAILASVPRSSVFGCKNWRWERPGNEAKPYRS